MNDQDILTILVSQFTLFGQLNKGNKPSFHEAADAETARRVYDYFYQQLGKSYKPERVKDGVFQAMMDVELKNDGPVCLPVPCYLHIRKCIEPVRSSCSNHDSVRSPSRSIRSSRRKRKGPRRTRALDQLQQGRRIRTASIHTAREPYSHTVTQAYRNLIDTSLILFSHPE